MELTDETAKELADAINRICSLFEDIESMHSPFNAIANERIRLTDAMSEFSNVVHEHTKALKAFRPSESR